MLFRTTVTLRQPTDRTRLDKLGVTVLETATTGGDETAQVLVTADQLATLARLGFDPRATDSVTAMLNRQPTALLAPLAEQARTAEAAPATGDAPLARSLDATAAPLTDLRAAVQSLSAAQLAAVTGLTSNDDDADGLTNTQEIWWCTDPANADSDGDGVSDGDEVAAAKAWLHNWTDSYPASGKPFSGWTPLTDSAGHPDRHFACADDDYDGVPDQAETWDLGLNPNRESTDRDKFDDGQELFGTTNCPGSGGFCGYGVLPRNEDWGTITAQMPAWVKAPGNHPLVAAYPVPEVDVVDSSFHVQTVTEVTTDHTTITGTEKIYSTTKTDGTSSSDAQTEAWEDWQEVSHTTQAQPRTMDVQFFQEINRVSGNYYSSQLAMSSHVQTTNIRQNFTNISHNTSNISQITNIAKSVSPLQAYVADKLTGAADFVLGEAYAEFQCKKHAGAAVRAGVRTAAQSWNIMQKTLKSNQCGSGFLAKATCVAKAIGTRLKENYQDRLGSVDVWVMV